MREAGDVVPLARLAFPLNHQDVRPLASVQAELICDNRTLSHIFGPGKNRPIQLGPQGKADPRQHYPESRRRAETFPIRPGSRRSIAQPSALA
jgi:hypothetical protein